MLPFKPPREAQPSANEELVLDALPYFLKSKSRYHAKRKDITEYGLLANRKLRACATSVDGVVALRIKDTDSRQLGDPFLCAIEIKTKTSAETMRDLDDHIGKTGGESFVECEAGTPEFRDFIPEPSFRSQLCHIAWTEQGANGIQCARWGHQKGCFSARERSTSKRFS